jgi:signal transduction histidine kinase
MNESRSPSESGRSKSCDNSSPDLEDGRDEKAMREAFLATTRHDLCTPINAIIGYSEMLLEDAEEEDAEEEGQDAISQDLARIKNAGHSLLA